MSVSFTLVIITNPKLSFHTLSKLLVAKLHLVVDRPIITGCDGNKIFLSFLFFI